MEVSHRMLIYWFDYADLVMPPFSSISYIWAQRSNLSACRVGISLSNEYIWVI